jgi:hypothetical protein
MNANAAYLLFGLLSSGPGLHDKSPPIRAFGVTPFSRAYRLPKNPPATRNRCLLGWLCHQVRNQRAAPLGRWQFAVLLHVNKVFALLHGSVGFGESLEVSRALVKTVVQALEQFELLRRFQVLAVTHHLC